MSADAAITAARDKVEEAIANLLRVCQIDGTLTEWFVGTCVQAVDPATDKIKQRYDYQVGREQPRHHTIGLVTTISQLSEAWECEIVDYGKMTDSERRAYMGDDDD